MSRTIGSKNKKLKRIKSVCKNCKKIYSIYPYLKDIRQFCSLKCSSKFIANKEKNRKENSKRMTISWKEKKIKSKPAWNKGKKTGLSWNRGMKGYLSGRKHWNWKGGITPIYKLVKGKAEWKKWRKKVFERDDYTCKMCSAKSGKDYDGTIRIEPHHRISVKKLINNNFKKYIYDIRNGITLCYKCHRYIHNKH